MRNSRHMDTIADDASSNEILPSSTGITLEFGTSNTS